MTPEQKIARLSGLCARLVSLVCAADVMLSTDHSGAMALMNEALMHSRDIRALRAPDGETAPRAVFPNLTILSRDEPPEGGADTFEARLAAIEAHLGSNGGPPLIDPPTPSAG